jgi:hypothetical protein
MVVRKDTSDMEVCGQPPRIVTRFIQNTCLTECLQSLNIIYLVPEDRDIHICPLHYSSYIDGRVGSS